MNKIVKVGLLCITMYGGTAIAGNSAAATIMQNHALQEELVQHRAEYQHYFDLAYEQYPSIPKGLLESLAYTASRWQHRIPNQQHIHDARPQPIGLFGLYDTDKYGFVNTLALVAEHGGVDKQRLIDSVEDHILFAASFIASQLTSTNKSTLTLADASEVLKLLSGITGDDEAVTYAKLSFAYDVLLTANQGIEKDGIEIKAQPVDWPNAFSRAQLNQLKAPHMILDTHNKSIRIKTPQDDMEADYKKSSILPMEKSVPIPKKQASSNNVALNAASVVDYAGAVWKASPNKSSRAGTQISHIVIHTTQGTYAGSISWLINPDSNVSAHYIIRSSDGQITQMVREHDKAWHARTANSYSIGIEHEGWVDNANWYTEAMYQASANLSIDLCQRLSIKCVDAYQKQAHSSVVTLDFGVTVKGHQHYPDQSHTDPGINWDWQGYYEMINNGVSVIPANIAPVAHFTFSCIELKCEFNASTSTDEDGNITKYQWSIDGQTGITGRQISYEFDKGDAYNIRLTVTDDDGEIHSAMETAVVTAPKSSSGSFGLSWILLLSIIFMKRTSGFTYRPFI